MVFNADTLWWQPHAKVYASASSSGGDGSSKALDKHEDWLLQLLAKFKRPNSTSKGAIENESHLESSGKKAPVETKLRPLVLQVSSHLVSKICSCGSSAAPGPAHAAPTHTHTLPLKVSSAAFRTCTRI